MNRSNALPGRLVCALLLLVAVAVASLGPRTAVAQQENTAATRQYAAAVSLQNRGLFDLAAEEWVKFIEDHAADARVPRAFHYLGVCHLKAGHPKQAAEAFQTVVDTYPEFKQLEATYFYLGVTQYTMGQQGQKAMYDAAAKTFATLLEKYPESKYAPQALFYRAESFYAQGKKQEAVGLYEQFLDEHAEHELANEALYALGVAQQEVGQAAAAGKTFDRFLKAAKESPLRAEVIMRRAETLFAQKMYGPAADWFRSAAGFEGFKLADHATLRQAASLAMQKKYAEAAALYATIPGKYPDSQYIPTANLEGGKAYYLVGEYGKARDMLAKVASGEGERAAEAAHWTARAMLKQNQPAEAAALVEKALPAAEKTRWHSALLLDRADAVYEIPARRGEAVDMYATVAEQYPDSPEAPEALYMAGFTALGQNQFAEALKYAQLFLQKHAGNGLKPDVLYVAAESQLQQKQFDEAAKGFATLIDQYPNRPEADAWKVRHGLALHLQKKYQETIDALKPVADTLKPASGKAEAFYLIGSSHAELKQFQPAVEALKNSLAAKADWRQADDTLLVLARAQQKSGKTADAIATIKQLIERYPNSNLADQAHYRLAEYSYASGDFGTAETEYRRVIDDYGKSRLKPHALFGLGWSLLSQDRYAQAEEELTQLVDEFPQHDLTPQARYARGMARQQLGQFAAGAEDVQALLDSEPTPEQKADARYVLGLCQVGLEKYGPAVKTFQALLDDAPDYASADKALYELAWAQKSQGKDKPAVEAFAKLAERFPESPLAAEARYHVAEADYAAGEFSKAAGRYSAAMKAAGKSTLGEKAAHKLGWSFYRIDDLKKAAQTFEYQLATWPQGELKDDAQFMLAECRFQQEQFEDALAGYEKLGEPSTAEFRMLALLHGAQSAAQLKEWEKALEMASEAVEQYPDSPHLPEAMYEKGWALQNLGKKDEALATYEQVIAKTDRESAARAQFMIGEIQFENKQHREAIVSFFKVIASYGYPKWQADASYEAARCFEVLDYKSKAIEQYEELIKSFPKSDKVEQAQERLAELRG